ncbi:shikimate dehydrogenase [Candidatus Woesearchaeota archaeon]|nr:shikimate dehydrogenase [Candidatus Woesearchaeota archaeon]
METKICIPITAKTAEQALKELRQAEKLADITELRIDYIKNIDEIKLKNILKKKTKKVIVTCRPDFEGGYFTGRETERFGLLKKAIKLSADYVDIEFKSNKDFIKELIKNKKSSKIIVSYHNFSRTPDLGFLKKLKQEIKKLNPDLIKIITFAESINDNFKIFELLKDSEDLISFCMGLRGQISRILAKKYGSCLTYASLTPGKESASGQLTIDELSKLYNFDMQNKDTKILGVIGEFAENSKSKFMHNPNFKIHNLNFVYIPFKVRPEELPCFMENFRKFDFRGSAVTVPHKEKIFGSIDVLDDTAKKIGASNTLAVKNKKIIGFNTDYYGAAKALKEVTEIKGKNILVLGAGGAARAVLYSLCKENSFVTIINRTKEKAVKLASEFHVKFNDMNNIKRLITKSDIIINTTSVGMNPRPDASLINKDDLLPGKIVMDIVYNPVKTRLIKYAEEKGCTTVTGDRMLIYQAIGQFELWTGVRPDFKSMELNLNKHLLER